MKKIDIVLSLITGAGVGFLFLWLIKNSAFNTPLIWFLPVVFPALALLGIWLAYLIGKKFLFVYQLAKFLLIGAFFAIFDLIIFNSLISWLGINKESGETMYSFIVASSFVIATCVKYIADKYWAFEKKGSEKAGKEFGIFFVITLISGVIQTIIATVVFEKVNPVFGLNTAAWMNIGKLSGIFIASAWNFLGYKFFVFKK